MKRYAVLLFVLTAALIGAVAVTLDRNAHRSNWNQTSTGLASGARVAAASMATLRSNLRVDSSKLAASLPLQRALLTNDRRQLAEFARTHHALIKLADARIGTLPRQPRISSSATIIGGGHLLARVTIALPIGRDVLTVIHSATPLPKHAALLFVRDGRVVAGAKPGARVALRGDRLKIGGTDFAAKSAPLGVARVNVVAVEPVSAVAAESRGYRRFVILASLATLALLGTLATRLARPLAQVVSDVGRLTRQVQTDALTGIANRRSLDERFDVELQRAAAASAPVSFVMIDLDNFKSINDVHGHQAGDDILRAVAAALRNTVRDDDLPARYGGEEFAVILPGTPVDAGRRAAERMRAAVEQIAVERADGEPIRVTASFGVADFPTYPTAEGVVGAADAALYQAKRAGKNRVATSTVQDDADADGAPPVPTLAVTG